MMSKFNELMSLEHVRNHPMFANFGERVKAMRENMNRKGAAPDLKDIFSSQRSVGMGSNDRSVRSFIQEAALSARSVLDMLDFPMQPQLTFNNVKNVKMAVHDDSQVVDAEVLFNVRICTKSGAVRQALIPVTVSRGVIVPPSTIIYNQQMRVIAQSTVDEIVQRNTAYQLPPMRRMYDPPLVGQELDNAASERNTLGWIPREVVTDGAGIRYSRRQEASANPENHIASYAMHLVGQDVSNPSLPRDVKNPGGEGGGAARSTDDVIDPLSTEPSKIWEGKKAQDKTNPGTPRSLGVPGSDDTQMAPQDGTHVAPGPSMAEDPNLTQLARPGYERGIPGYQGMGQYSQAATPSDELFRQIMAQPTVSQQIQAIFDSITPESITDQIMQMVGPLLASTGIDQNEIDWAYLVDELNSSFGGLMPQQRAGKVGMAEVRKVALLIAEYATGRRMFGRRRAAASTADAITELQTNLQSSQGTFKPEEYTYYTQLLQEAQGALAQGDEQQAQDLVWEVEKAFSMGDLSQREQSDEYWGGTQDVKPDYWSTFVATCKKFAQQTNVVKENEEDEDGLTPMKRFAPAGYDLVLEDMVAAEDTGLDTFPRPYSHIERNYILRRYPTCSRDKWLPHLINDGFALNPYGKGPNRGRPVREASKQAAGGGGAEELARWLEGVVLLRGCVSTDGVIELTDSSGRPTKVYVAIVHDGSGFNPGAALAVSESSSQGALEEAYQVLEDHLFSGNGYLNEEDIKEAYETEEREGYNPITETFDGAVFEMTAQEFQQVVESAGGLAGDELKVIEFASFEEEGLDDSFESGPEAPIEPKLSRSAQMDDGSVGMDVDTHEAVWGLGAEAAREARGEFDLDGAFLAAVQKYGTKVFPAAEVREDDPWFEEFFQAFREGAESALPRTAQMDDEVTFDIRMEPDPEQIDGNASAIDPVTDKEIVDHIKEELRNGNDWAWCQVQVVASYVDDDGNEYTGESSWLGGCSYESERDFIDSKSQITDQQGNVTHSGYYDDMKKEAYEDLLREVHGSDEDLSMSMDQRRSSKSQGAHLPPKFVSEIERRVAQMDVEESEPEEVETGYNWEAIKKKMESEPWTTGWEGTGPGDGAVRSVYLGQMINPSGKFYMPWTTNQTDEGVEKDQAFWEKLEEEASAAGYSITSGEGDPTDTFVIEFKAWDEFPPHEQAALESGEDVYEGQLEEELTMSPEEKGR